jgi:hypothetical protein
MRTVRNVAFVILAGLSIVLQPTTVAGFDTCRYSNCTCGQGAPNDYTAHFEWGSGTLDCNAADEFCEDACSDCFESEALQPDCDDQALTIDCDCMEPA